MERAEFHTRLLRRPTWHPAHYPGICVACGEQVDRNDPVMLMRTDNGPRWTCSCIFMPKQPISAKLDALRVADRVTQ